MKKLQFLLFAALALLVLACQSEPKTGIDAANLVSETGYPYAHLIKNGGATPQVGDEVTYHMSMHKNDSLLGSTFVNPFPQKAVIPDTTVFNGRRPVPDYEGIMLMSPGDSLEIYNSLDIVPEAIDPSQVQPGDIFKYTIKLVSIKPKLQRLEEETAAKAEAAKNQAREAGIGETMTQRVKDYSAGKLDAEIQTTTSGLKYIIHEKGSGLDADGGDVVNVNYYGVLLDGTEFDNSFKKGSGIEFPLGVGRVIRGWDEGIALLKEGDKATLFIPYALAYGEAGSPPNIPAKSDLAFYVELVKVQKAN